MRLRNPRIENEDKVIGGRFLELANHEFAAACGGAPVNPLETVAAAKAAHPVEFTLSGWMAGGPSAGPALQGARLAQKTAEAAAVQPANLGEDQDALRRGR